MVLWLVAVAVYGSFIFVHTCVARAAPRHERKPNHGALVGKLVLLIVGMFGFGYLLVPMYDVFCEITGLNGKTGDQAAAVAMEPDLDRLVTVEFIASVNQGAPWEFRPSVSRMEVHPGQDVRHHLFCPQPVGRIPRRPGGAQRGAGPGGALFSENRMFLL